MLNEVNMSPENLIFMGFIGGIIVALIASLMNYVEGMMLGRARNINA